MKALIADVDDTICPSTRPIEPEVAAAINRFVAQGRIFAFISGSTFRQIRDQITPSLTVNHHLLGTSGTHYVKVTDGQETEMYRECFKQEEKQKIIAAFRDLMKRHSIKTMTTDEDQLQDRDSQITLSAIGRHAPEDAKRTFDPDGSRRRLWVEELIPVLGDGYNIRVGGTSSIDITARGIDKAWGIRRFLELNNLQADECLYLGDNLDEGGNDYPARSVVTCMAVESPADTLRFLNSLRIGN